MKKFTNFISCAFVVGLPIFISSCAHDGETQIINLNNYSLTDDEYQFKTSLWQHLPPYRITADTPRYYLFSNRKYIDENFFWTAEDNKFMLNNIKSYFGFSNTVNNEYSYNDSLYINNEMSNFSEFYSLLDENIFKETICRGFFETRDKDFYIKKGFSEKIIDSLKENYKRYEFYNYNDKTNKINFLNDEKFYQFIKELADNKYIENNDVLATIDYNYSLTETVDDDNKKVSDYEQTFRIRFTPNPNKDFAWHNGSKKAIVFWFDTNLR